MPPKGARKRMRADQVAEQLRELFTAAWEGRAPRAGRVNPMTGERVRGLRQQQRIMRGETLVVFEADGDIDLMQRSRVRSQRKGPISPEQIGKGLLAKYCCDGLTTAPIESIWQLLTSVPSAVAYWAAAVLSQNNLSFAVRREEGKLVIDILRRNDLLHLIQESIPPPEQAIPAEDEPLLANVELTPDVNTLDAMERFTKTAAFLPLTNDEALTSALSNALVKVRRVDGVRRQIADALRGVAETVLSGQPLLRFRQQAAAVRRGRQRNDNEAPRSMFEHVNDGLTLMYASRVLLGSLPRRIVLLHQALTTQPAYLDVPRGYSAFELCAILLEAAAALPSLWEVVSPHVSVTELRRGAVVLGLLDQPV